MSLYAIKKKLDILNLFQKSTNAMKVMALSSRNQIKKILTKKYSIVENVQFFMSQIFDYLVSPSNNLSKNTVFIFLGEERGFCGSFSNSIEMTYQKIISLSGYTTIVIGKAFYKKIKKYGFPEIIIENFKPTQVDTILAQILATINFKNPAQIIIYYMQSKSLTENYMQKIILEKNYTHYKFKKNIYSGHFNSESIITLLMDEYIKNMLHIALLESLYGEQSARYIAMDGALKNTEDNIEEHKKLYFKLRQKKINRELEDVIINLI